MDGDSSTTDASQLGISADYIGGSHYVIQPHDGKRAARAPGSQAETGLEVEVLLTWRSRLLLSLQES